MDIVDVVGKLYDQLMQLESTINLDVPLEGTLGVPQRSYGYTGGKIQRLQTSNVNYCVLLSGCNGNGAFLAHIDEYCFKQGQVHKMLLKLNRILKGSFDITLIYNSGNDGRQQYVSALKEMLLPFQKELFERRKRVFQSLNLGIDITGKLYYPGAHVANEANDELEEWFFVRRGEGHAPEGYYRENLSYINEAKGIIIPPEAFSIEQIPRWMSLKATRAKIIDHIGKLFQLTHGNYAELAQGRPYSIPEQNGALVLI